MRLENLNQRAAGQRHTRRGFTLIETMVVVAILGIITALAVPALAPMRFRAESLGSTTAVADFLAQARATAMSSRRCTRVSIQAAGPPTVLELEKLNAFDCGDSTELPSTAPRADGATPSPGNLWLNVATLRLDASAVTFALVPTETAVGNHPDGVGARDEIRFRSTGRLYSNDNDLTDDDAVLRIEHPRLPGAINSIDVLVESFGRICQGKRGQPIATGPGDYSCP